MMPKKKTFENTLIELQAIIEELESETPSLDKMVFLFEEGMKLMKMCQDQLNHVEERVVTLIKENNNYFEKKGINQ